MNSKLAEAILESVRRVVSSRSSAIVNMDTPLVSSGLIDSMAVLEIILLIEKTGYNVSEVEVEDVDSPMSIYRAMEEADNGNSNR